MHIHLDPTGEVDALASILEELSGREDIGSLFILGGDQNGWTPDALDPVLASLEKPVFGGTFPAIIHGEDKLDKGTIVVGIKPTVITHVIHDLNSSDSDFDAKLDETVGEIDELQTLLVFVDGLCRRIGGFFDSLYSFFGLGIHFIGGGAGSLDFEHKPCLITPGGLIENAALLVELETRSGVGVSHGWSSIGGPYVATEVDQNAIRTLDWNVAFDLYREVVEPSLGEPITDENFFQKAMSYPFGIGRMDAEMVVRDPYILQSDGSMVVVGEIPVGAHLYILNGDNSSLIEAAGNTVTLAERDFGSDDDPSLALFIDCISRVLFLKDEFESELRAANTCAPPLVGMCSMGEIANNGKEYVELYNKTAVMGLLDV